MVASVAARVKGMAAAGALACAAIGLRPRLAGAGAVPGAPMPVLVGVMVLVIGGALSVGTVALAYRPT